MPVGAKPSLRRDPKPIGRMYAPKWLSPDAAEEWNRVQPELAERRILTTPDLAMLEQFVVQIGIARAAERQLQAEGFVVATNAGPKRHPASVILQQATTLARQLASELGLTPVSCSRPAVRDDDEGDDLLDL